MLVEPIELVSGQIVGALIVARHGRVWSQREFSIVKAFGSLFGKVASQTTREGALLHQRRLDELVSQVAEKLMSATAATRQEVLSWTIRMLGEFLDSDVAFLRRNDHVRGLSILEAEWPIRDDFTGPDPLGEVRFDSDPIFMATKDLREPYLPGLEDANEDYLDRVEKGSGETLVVGRGRAAPARRHDLGRSRIHPLRVARLEALGDQRPPGRRLDARAAAGPHRRRRAHGLHCVARRLDGPAQPSSAPA